MCDVAANVHIQGHGVLVHFKHTLFGMVYVRE